MNKNSHNILLQEMIDNLVWIVVIVCLLFRKSSMTKTDLFRVFSLKVIENERRKCDCMDLARCCVMSMIVLFFLFIPNRMCLQSYATSD